MPGRAARFRRGVVRRRDRVTWIAPQVDIIRDLDVVEIAVTPGPASNDPSVVPVTVEVLAVDPAHVVDLDVVEITHQVIKPTVQSFDGDPVPLTVDVLPVDPAHIVDLDVVDIVHSWDRTKVAYTRKTDTADIGVESIVATSFSMDTQPVGVTVEVLEVEVGFSVEDIEAHRGVQSLPDSSPTRVIAQSILSGEFVHWDLEVDNLQYTQTLSGPVSITGEFTTEIYDYRDLNLEPWGTWIYVEENGEIKATGILQPSSVNDGEALTLEALGYSAYPNGIPYLSNYSQEGVDPADVYRHIWAHVQAFPDAKLGVVVRGTTTKKVGMPVTKTTSTTTTPEGGGDPVTTETTTVEANPYKLDWWEAKDCGSELDNLAKEAPFDYVEVSKWNDTKTAVLKYIDIGYPRIGRRRDDLAFRQDENLLRAVGPEETDDFYASQIVFMGAGEGSEIVNGIASRQLRTRIRRVAVVADGTIVDRNRAIKLAANELDRRQAILDIKEIEIKAQHLNARLGSFSVGDDILVEAEVPWIGAVRQWERVLAYTYDPTLESVRVSLRRAESFTYGGT